MVGFNGIFDGQSKRTKKWQKKKIDRSRSIMSFKCTNDGYLEEKMT